MSLSVFCLCQILSSLLPVQALRTSSWLPPPVWSSNLPFLALGSFCLCWLGFMRILRCIWRLRFFSTISHSSFQTFNPLQHWQHDATLSIHGMYEDELREHKESDESSKKRETSLQKSKPNHIPPSELCRMSLMKQLGAITIIGNTMTIPVSTMATTPNNATSNILVLDTSSPAIHSEQQQLAASMFEGLSVNSSNNVAPSLTSNNGYQFNSII